MAKTSANYLTEAIPASTDSATSITASTTTSPSSSASEVVDSTRSSNTTPAEVTQEFVKPKVVEKIFGLPVVSDTYNLLVKLDALMQLSKRLGPSAEKISTLASPVVDQALHFKAGIEGKVPRVVRSGYTTALNKVIQLQGVPKKRTFRIIILQAAASGISDSRRLESNLPEAAACRMMILKVCYFWDTLY